LDELGELDELEVLEVLDVLGCEVSRIGFSLRKVPVVLWDSAGWGVVSQTDCAIQIIAMGTAMAILRLAACFVTLISYLEAG
jgi:hypothetical protein